MKTRHDKIDYYRRRQRSYELPDTLHKLRAAVRDQRGFTLIELIVIMVIIGILLVVALPTYSYIATKAKVSRAVSEIRTLEKDVTSYLIEKGALPPSGPLGMDAIGRSGFLDPWKRPYQYLNIPSGGTPYQDDVTLPLNADFDIFSAGRDGISTQSLADASCEDDIIRAGDGGYVGLGEDYKL